MAHADCAATSAELGRISLLRVATGPQLYHILEKRGRAPITTDAESVKLPICTIILLRIDRCREWVRGALQKPWLRGQSVEFWTTRLHLGRRLSRLASCKGSLNSPGYSVASRGHWNGDGLHKRGEEPKSTDIGSSCEGLNIC
jgi:hypothetical protein